MKAWRNTLIVKAWSNTLTGERLRPEFLKVCYRQLAVAGAQTLVIEMIKSNSQLQAYCISSPIRAFTYL